MKYLFTFMIGVSLLLCTTVSHAQDNSPNRVECIGPPPAGDIAGPTTVSAGQQGVAFSVDPIERATGYEWTLPNGATIATGYNTRSITVNFANDAESGQITVAGTFCVYTGIASSFNITVNPLLNISGNIRTPDGQNIENVTVTIDNGLPDVTTITDGNYAFNELPGNQNYTVAVSKTNDVKSGLNLIDVGLLRRHILYNTLLGAHYKLVAADLDQSGIINNDDQLLMQRIILGTETSLPAVWRFMTSDYNFPFNPLVIPPKNPYLQFDEYKSYIPLSSSVSNEDFIACYDHH